MDGRKRVAHAKLKVCAFLLDLVGGDFNVAEVVQRVKAADDVYAVADSFLDELTNYIISVMTIAYEVLTA